MKIVFIGENPTVKRLVELSAAKAGMTVEIATWSECDLSDVNFVVAEYETLGEDGVSVLSFAPINVKKIAVMPRDEAVPEVFDASIRKPFLPTELVDLFLSQAPIENVESSSSHEEGFDEVSHDDINLDELDAMMQDIHHAIDDQHEVVTTENDDHTDHLETEVNELSHENDVLTDELAFDDEISFDDAEEVIADDQQSVMNFDEEGSQLLDQSDALVQDDAEELSFEGMEDDLTSQENSDEFSFDDVLDDAMTKETLDDDMFNEGTNDELVMDDLTVDEEGQFLTEEEPSGVTTETISDDEEEDFDSYLTHAVEDEVKEEITSEDEKSDDSILDMNDIAQLKDLLNDDEFGALDEHEMKIALGEECDEDEAPVSNNTKEEIAPSCEEIKEPTHVAVSNTQDLAALLATLTSQKIREVLDGATITVSITYPKKGDNQ